jgi:serine/threonine protein kinase
MFPSDRPPGALQGFDILQRLGSGGAGEVFLARSRAGKLVAIKTIADAASRPDDASANTLAREASVCARLTHPCIVQVRAFLEEPGFAALVFEYVPGVALGRVLRLCQSHGVRLPDRAAWHIVERVLEALAYAHGFQEEDGQITPIVHRDLSPSNILVDWSGGVKIADFGIAKVVGVSTGTRVGVVKGTMGCMAPEQARGEPVDERADVYAAALLAWRLATGRVPFAQQQHDEFELLRAMRNPRLKPLAVLRPDLPEPLLDAVARALEPVRERRTIRAGELADVVRAQVDVGSGREELAMLLDSWRGALERAVRRVSAADKTPASGAIPEHTLRYEEVALAFDDDVGADRPTVETHALPSDPSALAALPLADAAEESGDRSPHAALPVVPTPAAAFGPAWPPAVALRRLPAPPAQPITTQPPAPIPERARLRSWRPIIAIALFVAVCFVVALLAATGR